MGFVEARSKVLLLILHENVRIALFAIIDLPLREGVGVMKPLFDLGKGRVLVLYRNTMPNLPFRSVVLTSHPGLKCRVDIGPVIRDLQSNVLHRTLTLGKTLHYLVCTITH